MGTDKTVVLGEASDILSQRRLVHAAVDVDSLGLDHLPSRVPSDAVMYENLRAIYGNYAKAGVRRFLVARAIESETQLKLCRNTIRQQIPSSVVSLPAFRSCSGVWRIVSPESCNVTISNESQN